uniref:Uncharacterized protein n=1 Tax=Trichuris muris TaxID=70415 RepID=A0A5S6QP92_TRIMR
MRRNDLESEALHSLRSLLCTATNTTPHKQMFKYNRRSTTGTSLPTWLLRPRPVLLKKLVRLNKWDPLVEEVELLEANPQYACVRLPNGRESTVSLRHLAPAGSPSIEMEHENKDEALPAEKDIEKTTPSTEIDSVDDRATIEPEQTQLRRSTRTRRPPIRLDL